MLATSILDLIGNTPTMELKRIQAACNVPARLFAKLECFNPAGSIKDRAAYSMIAALEKSGALRAGGVIVEPTSGNTGIGAASIAACKGYKVILTMPDTMSEERRKLLGAYGAELVLTPGALGMQGAVEKAEALVRSIPGAVMLGQFNNKENAAAHYTTTGPELYRDLGGSIDILVCTVGSGGTITGVGRYLKEQNPAVHVVAVEPKNSPVLSGGKAGAHQIQGIGAGFVPGTLDTGIYDEIITVEDACALQTGARIARVEGLLVGISAGAALFAAIELAKRPVHAGKCIAMVFADTGERYLSSGMF